VSGRGAAAERRLGLALCAPAVLAMAAIAGYPILHAAWLSTWRYDLRFPAERRFVGLANYASVLGSEVWWEAFANTLLVTAASVSIELVLGLAIALAMHRAPRARGALRAAVLVPYAIVTVVAALAWRFAFDPATGFVNELLGSERAWLAHRGTAFAVIVLTEVWKTTPFLSLLLLAGLTLVPEDVLQAARVDGASRAQRFFRVTLPIMKPAIGVALLFRALDGFRIFDTIFVQTRGAQGTESVSLVGYHALVTRLNLGLGSAVSVLIFACVVAIAAALVKGLRVSPGRGLGGRA
jgi:multiple sugar transport system permease protein